MKKNEILLFVGGIIFVFIVTIFVLSVKTIPAGHVGIPTLFGKVQKEAYPEGFHVTNPFYGWTVFDARQKTLKEVVNVPSQDQLTTRIEVSVQFRVDRTLAASILKETGTTKDAIKVHLIPKVRSLLREQGKTVKRAEDFFMEATQKKLQENLREHLKFYLVKKGIEVQDVLIRDIQLPQFIVKAIESKKEREQEAEKQKAELERYRTEQKQKVAQAEAERQAAEQIAQKQRVLADAEAYQIQKITEALKENPVYVKLKALEALKAISKDPSAKIYFLNGDSPHPLPLLKIGDK